MRPRPILFIPLLGTCLAKSRWQIVNAGDHQGFIIQHFQDALLIAREAADLLDKSYGSDSNVNDVVDALFTGGSEAVKKCTEILRNIASYDQSPSESFLKPDNMDLYLDFDFDSAYEEDTDNGRVKRRNKHVDKPVTPQQIAAARACFDKTVEIGKEVKPGQYLVETKRSEDVNLIVYNKKLKEWLDNGKSLAGPDFSEAVKPRPGVPNSMDICDWYIRYCRKDGNQGSRIVKDGKLNKDLIEDIRDGKRTTLHEKQESQMDILGQTFTATLLHELTHTTLGGWTLDVPEDNCYGWEAVANVARTPYNAENIAYLAVSLFMVKHGYKPSDFTGDIYPI